MGDEFTFIPPQAASAFGAFAAFVRTSAAQAADSVKETSIQLAEQSATLRESLAENAALVKTKSFEVAESVKEKSAEVADSMKKGAVAVAENVQGRIAPKTVKREGYLAKQVSGNKWVEYYFALRDGSVFVLPTQNAEQPDFSITLDCILRAEPLDILVTNKPFCFRVTIRLADKETTVVNDWSFFGSGFFTSNRVNNQEVDIILQATNEEDMKGWARELYSTSSGLAMQEQVKKTSEEAIKISTTRVSSFMDSLTSLVSRAGSNPTGTDNANTTS